MKKIALLIICVISLSLTTIYGSDFKKYDDVPADHWAYDDIHTLRSMSVLPGALDNTFGLGGEIILGEFARAVNTLMAYSEDPSLSPFEVLQKRGLIDDTPFVYQPTDLVTKQQAAVILVKALGYENIAENIGTIPVPFTDITSDWGYITMAYDFGIISGNSEGLFYPNKYITREETASMLMNFYRAKNKTNNNLTFLNSFYAIKSYDQSPYIPSFNAVSFGWARLDLTNNNTDVYLNMTSQNSNEYSVPSGFTEPFNKAGTKMLMVTGNDCKTILENDTLRQKALKEITAVLNSYTKDNETIVFDGVVIDFENLKGDHLKGLLTQFLKDLRAEIGSIKLIYTAVHPQVKSGGVYFDAYDFKAIGEISDKVILMAHDYNAKNLSSEEMNAGITTTPLTPIDEIYYALRTITDSATGVSDRNKIVLQLNFDIAQWKLIDGKVINSAPYNPTYESLYNRLLQGDCTINYSKRYENPYVTFINPEDGSENIAWYEDERSVSAKINLAKMFDIYGISLWRLGNIPDYADENFHLNVLKTVIQ